MLAQVILWLLSFIPHTVIQREAGVPYLTRYYLLGGPRYGVRKLFPWNVYLHCFHTSDEPVPHNHPWVWAKSLILRGAYLEHRGVRFPKHVVYTKGRWNRLARETFHWVELITPTVWTLFISGPRVKEDYANAWGFYTSQGLIPWGQYKGHK